MSERIQDRGYGEHMDPQTRSTGVDKDDTLDVDYEVSKSSVESEDGDDSDADDTVSESSGGSEDGDGIDVDTSEPDSDEESEDETSTSEVSDSGTEDDVDMENGERCSAVRKSTGSSENSRTIVEGGFIPKLGSQQSGDNLKMMGHRFNYNKGDLMSAWKAVLESFAYLDNKTGVQVGDIVPDNDLLLLPEEWTTSSAERRIDIDTARLTEALQRLHSSMTGLLHDFHMTGRGYRQKEHQSYWVQKKARKIVAIEYLGSSAQFDERVRDFLETIPHGSRKIGSLNRSADSKISKAILDDLDADEHAVALAKVKKLTNELLSSASLKPNTNLPTINPKISALAITCSPANFSECRAKHHAMLDVASTLVKASEFRRRIKADARIWEAKSAWLGTHTKETKAASARSVASEILRTNSEQDRRAVNGQLEQIFEEYSKTWKADDSRQVSDKQIAMRFYANRRDVLIVIAAEHVSALKNYRAELPVPKESHERRRQEHRIAVKVLESLDDVARNESLERAEALAVALTERYVREGPRKQGRPAFMDSIKPMNDAEGSDDTDSTSSEERDDDGEDATMEEEIEMPAAKRVKVTRSDAQTVERSALV